MKQTRVQKSRTPVPRETEVHADSRTKRVRERGQAEAAALKSELDELLDAVDEVLEENAEEFVKGYVQKGGE